MHVRMPLKRKLKNRPGKLKPGFHIIAPVATVVAVVEKRVLTQKYFLSDASKAVFPYDRRCRSISLKLGRGDLGSITNFCARIWRYFQNAGRCERRNRRNRLEFLQIPPVTSPDISKFLLRISGTHVKLFFVRSSLAFHLHILVFITFTVLIVNTVVFLHFFHEENYIDFSTGRHFEECARKDELHHRMFSLCEMYSGKHFCRYRRY